MNFNFTVKLNIQSKNLETKVYMIVMIAVTSLLAIWLYSVASSTLSEDQVNSITGFNTLHPRLTEEIAKPTKK